MEKRKETEANRKETQIKRKILTGRMLKEQLPYAFWLHTVEGLGNPTRRLLEAYAGTPKEVYTMPAEELGKLLPQGKLKRLEQAKRRRVTEEYERLTKSGIHFLPMLHPDYPRKLSMTPDPPYALLVRGRLPDESIPAVAVIGARECSPYGRYMAESCGEELARAGIQVISGMARGIDGMAQRAALQAGGNTYAVLGCGVDVCYPAQNREIYERMKSCGGICSEYPPRTPPRAQLFPPRNRIISGLSDLVLIIEAREKSGTLITADMALEQGREVYVLPGRVTDALSEGCNRLLKQGAGVFISVRELLEENGWMTEALRRKEAAEQAEGKVPAAAAAAGSGGSVHGKEECDEKERVAACLDFSPLSVSDLQCRTGMEYRRLVYLLFRLCMEGRARQVSGDSYIQCR